MGLSGLRLLESSVCSFGYLQTFLYLGIFSTTLWLFMREPEMFEPMKNLLESKGYKILEVKRGREPGPDIVAERQGRKLVMEMKGDSAALDVDFGTGIFQLFRSMQANRDEDYALGISEAYVRLARQAEYPLKKLGIKIFVVDDKSYQLW